MSDKTPKLFQPFKLRDLTLGNRIVVAPMCQYSGNNGMATDWHLMHVGNLAQSGAGLIIMEMTNIEARGRISPYCLGLWNDQQEAALKRVVDFCKSNSTTAMGLQIAHAGRKASHSPPWDGGLPLSDNQGGWPAVAPSAIALSESHPAPGALTSGEIEGLIEAFAHSAERAGRIGYDTIELHAAHGYLLHQFLSPLSNRREDEYGGSLENRMRFTLQAFKAMREVWPADKPMGVRISATDWQSGGWDIEQSLALSKALQQLGCDYMDISSGGLLLSAKIDIKPGYQVPFAERIKMEIDIPVMAVGLITQAQQAEDILQQDRADMVALARGMLYNPRWPWHAAAELDYDFPLPNQYKRCQPTR